MPCSNRGRPCWQSNRGSMEDMIQMREVREKRGERDNTKDRKSQKIGWTKRERERGSSLLVSVKSDLFRYLSLSHSTRNPNSYVLSALWLGTMLKASVNTCAECWSADTCNLNNAGFFVIFFPQSLYIKENNALNTKTIQIFDSFHSFLSIISLSTRHHKHC